MKILIISKSGDSFGIAQKMQEEGHEIRIWVKESGFDFVLKNIIEQVPSWRPSASHWADLVISDMVGFGRMATVLDNFDVPHVAFNQISDMMELDRSKRPATIMGTATESSYIKDLAQNPWLPNISP